LGGLAFALLGPVEVRTGDRRLDIGPPKQRLVLAVLLLAANRPVPIDRLVDLSWPDSPPPTARTAIHGRISKLRALLTAADPEVALLSEGSGYRLCVDEDLVDAHRFTALVKRARATASDALAVPLYEQALALWQGRPLDGTAAEDVRRQLCGSLEEARQLALDDHTDAQLRLGRHREVVDQLIQRLESDPVRERTAGQLALALYRCGRAGQALDVCGRTRRRLRDELGVDPGPALAALETALLRNDPALVLPTPPASAMTVPAHLPPDVAGFTGRAAEVRRLTELLSGDAPTTTVIAVVSGLPGAGKTALAVHCGHQVAGWYPDGQLFVNLRGYDPREPVRPVDALARFLRALGVPPGQVPGELDEAVLLYRSLLASRRVIVVLDNAGSAEQVRPLLPGAAGCAALVTGREELRGLVALDGARPLRLDILPRAESVALLGRMVGRDRLAGEPVAAAELAELCGHLPLALRIAGAHLAGHPAQPVESYARDLAQGNRIGKLAIPEDPRAAVRAAFDLSYRALAPRLRRLFRTLGLVPGPDFTSAAAAAMAGCPVDEAEQDLDRLDTAHLVRRSGSGRYLFHDLLRLYAAERAEDEERPADRETALTGLFDFYLHHADVARRILYPHRIRVPLPDPPQGMVIAEFGDSSAALRWLEAELPNLTAAIHQAADTGRNREACLLADAIRGFFPGRGHTQEWFAVASTALRAATTENDPRLVTLAHLSLAEAHQRRAQYAAAIEHGTAARTFAGLAGWADGESTALGIIGSVHREAGELRAAAAYSGQALDINIRIGARHKQVIDLVNLGVSHAILGDLREAADYFHRAHEIGQRSSSPANTAMVLQCLGNVYRYLGRLTDAVGYLSEALAVSTDISDLGSQAGILDSLAGTHADAGRHDEATRLAVEALTLARQAGARRTEAATLATMGTIHHAQGQYRESLSQHGKALILASDLGYLAGEVDALIGIADVDTHLGDHAGGEARATHALTLARRTSHHLQEGQALTTLADNALAAADPERAVRLAREALAIHDATGYRLGKARTLRTLGHAVSLLDSTTAAAPHWHAAFALLTEIGTPEADDLRELTT
jgi:DNA-binding SARP family transcriptional activator